MNYLENYTCTRCSAAGVKLWREVHDTSGGWLCVVCGTNQERQKLKPGPQSLHWPFDANGVFTFAVSDQLGDLLPAVPTEDGTGIYGYGSVSDVQRNWWHSLPTYPDDLDLEVRCLRNLLRRTLVRLDCMAQMWRQAIKDKQALEER